jgi:CRP/FNR family cyclic AMP-dependent transcriptional regulator
MGVRIVGQEKLIAAALRGTRLFADWPESALQPLQDAAELWRYEKDEVIAERGDPAKGLWLLAAGSVVGYRSSPSGRYQIFGIIWPADVFGLMPVIDGWPMPLSHAARRQALIVFIPLSTMLAALADGERMHAVAVFMCARSRVEYEGMYTSAVDSLRCRLAKYLAYLPRRSIFVSEGPPGSPGWVDPSPVDLTQDELASMLGVARQTLNRAMRPFLQNGIVAREGDVIRVVDFRRLLAIMEENEPLLPAWRAEILSWDEKVRQTKDNIPRQLDIESVQGESTR